MIINEKLVLDTLSQLQVDEGFRSCVYKDSEGYWTIGHGILVDDRLAGAGITEEESLWLAERRVRKRLDELNLHIPWWIEQPRIIQKSLVNMSYQMGVPKLLGFRKMLAAMQQNDYVRAAEEALDSKWAQQTPDRAKKIADQIRSAEGQRTNFLQQE